MKIVFAMYSFYRKQLSLENKAADTKNGYKINV